MIKLGDIMFKKVVLATLMTAVSVSASVAMAADDMMRNNNGVQMMDEAASTVAIKTKYAAEPMLSTFDIHVTLKNKTAYLKGQVDTDMQYDKAIYIASSLKGVDDVNADELKVKDSKHPMDDAMITAKAKGALIRDAIFSDKEVDAMPFTNETKDGVVFVKGKARSLEVKNNALQSIKNVKGVKSVKDSITIDAN